MSFINQIGIGPSFPIILTELEDGTSTWKSLEGEPELLKSDLLGALAHSVGSMVRQENVGHRLEEILEEPNTQVAEHLAKKFILEYLNAIEPRLKRLTPGDIEVTKTSTSINLHISITLLEGEDLGTLSINL